MLAKSQAIDLHAANAWLDAAMIAGEFVFRKIDRWGNVSKRALEPSAVNAIVQQRAEMAGLDGR